MKIETRITNSLSISSRSAKQATNLFNLIGRESTQSWKFSFTFTFDKIGQLGFKFVCRYARDTLYRGAELRRLMFCEKKVKELITTIYN